MCSGSGNTCGGVLLKDRDQRRGGTEGVGDQPRRGFKADRGPQFAGDLGDQHAADQRPLRIKCRQPPQRDLLIGIGEANREAKAVIEWGRAAGK